MAFENAEGSPPDSTSQGHPGELPNKIKGVHRRKEAEKDV